MNKRLYIGNLPFKIEESGLEALFSQAGAVESVHVMRDTETGRARGFAFVEMATEQDATNAINKFHEYELDGRALTVNEARPKAQRAGRW
jgi:cold-inducible RNA-binding protein